MKPIETQAAEKCRTEGYAGFTLKVWSDSTEVMLYHDTTPVQGYAYTVTGDVWIRRAQSDWTVPTVHTQSVRERMVRP